MVINQLGSHRTAPVQRTNQHEKGSNRTFASCQKLNFTEYMGTEKTIRLDTLYLTFKRCSNKEQERGSKQKFVLVCYREDLPIDYDKN